MPIYEYRCADCGFQKEFLQKLSDTPITACPQCKQETMRKMVTAAGFQLKGSGWYVTDFRGGSRATDKAAAETKPDASSSGGTAAESTGSDSGKSESKSEGKSESKPESKAESKSETKSPSSSTSTT